MKRNDDCLTTNSEEATVEATAGANVEVDAEKTWRNPGKRGGLTVVELT